jgi:hypothetical protein
VQQRGKLLERFERTRKLDALIGIAQAISESWILRWVIRQEEMKGQGEQWVIVTELMLLVVQQRGKLREIADERLSSGR